MREKDRYYAEISGALTPELMGAPHTGAHPRRGHDPERSEKQWNGEKAGCWTNSDETLPPKPKREN